jgi:hypothetical protein
MGAIADQRAGIDLQRVAFYHREAAIEGGRYFGERWQAAAVAFHCYDLRTGAQQRTSQATGAGTDLEHAFALQRAGNGGDLVEQLLVA